MDIITEWNEEDRKLYGKKVMCVRHELEKTGLFTDERLAKLLDDHPNHLIDFQYLPNTENFRLNQQVSVDFSGFDGKTMIEAARSDTSIWVNVREAMTRDPEYRAVFDKMYDEVDAMTGQKNARHNLRGGLLISSPTAATCYHADPTLANLWHVRGHKKIWVYPVQEKFMHDTAYESIILGEIDEDLPFDTAWDADAIVGPADLTGGEFLSWPHRAPHRVDNVTFCVSVVAEYSTRQTIFVNSGIFTNGVMRRRFGADPKWDEASRPEKFVKAMSGFGMRRLGLRKQFRRDDIVYFRLNPSVDGFIQPVETPYQRSH